MHDLPCYAQCHFDCSKAVFWPSHLEIQKKKKNYFSQRAHIHKGFCVIALVHVNIQSLKWCQHKASLPYFDLTVVQNSPVVAIVKGTLTMNSKHFEYLCGYPLFFSYKEPKEQGI